MKIISSPEFYAQEKYQVEGFLKYVFHENKTKSMGSKHKSSITEQILTYSEAERWKGQELMERESR